MREIFTSTIAYLIVFLLRSVSFMILWNYCASDLFDIQSIVLWQSMSIVCMFDILKDK